MKKKKHGLHSDCNESPCWECHNEFMQMISPLVTSITNLYVALKKADRKRCDHRVKRTPSGFVCIKCGRFA